MTEFVDYVKKLMGWCPKVGAIETKKAVQFDDIVVNASDKGRELTHITMKWWNKYHNLILLISILGIFTEQVRKIMGWCPQDKVIYNRENVNFSYDALCTSTAAYNEKNKYMDISVQMFDWRIFVIMFGFIGLLLIGIQKLDIYVIILSLLVYTSLFIFDRTKISVDGEMLTIRTPVLGEKQIPVSDIDKVESFENYGNKHRVRTLISLTLVILFGLAGISKFSIMGVLSSVSTLLLIYVIYVGMRRAIYPFIIKINTKGRDVFLYPRNKHDLSMLMSIAPEKLKLRK